MPASYNMAVSLPADTETSTSQTGIYANISDICWCVSTLLSDIFGG